MRNIQGDSIIQKNYRLLNHPFLQDVVRKVKKDYKNYDKIIYINK